MKEKFTAPVSMLMMNSDKTLKFEKNEYITSDPAEIEFLIKQGYKHNEVRPEVVQGTLEKEKKEKKTEPKEEKE